jgi:acetate kinase
VNMKILVFNAGSSSQKSKLYEVNNPPPEQAPAPLWEGTADWTKAKQAGDLSIRTAHGATWKQELRSDSRADIVKQMLPLLWNGPTRVIGKPSDVAIVGHRVVHGGHILHESTLVTPQVKDTIRQLADFAPLHNPANLTGIEAAEQALSDIPQVAVFDTAFHAHLPREVMVYPGPYEWFDQGIRRYGFHGISHQYCARRSAQILGRNLSSLRIVNCHLGNGCSLAAIQDGRSIDTTMGFTPLEGLMMGSRSGSVDPSILTYLQRQQGYSTDSLEQTLNKASGLLGISGVSSDMRLVEQAMKDGNEHARLAHDMFIYRLRYFIGAMIASLGGVDVITFTGGIGENDAEIRSRTCQGFQFLRLRLDEQKNSASPVDQDIATQDSAVRVLVVHTEEDWEIALECWRLAQAGKLF